MKICSKCKTPVTSICQNGETFKFCPCCGGAIIEDDLYDELPEQYKDPYGIWKVSHKQENGSVKILGTYKGYLDEIALCLSDDINCCHDGVLQFSKVEETTLPITTPELYKMANITLDVNPSFNKAPLDSKVDVMKKILAKRPVNVIVDKCVAKVIYTGEPAGDQPTQTIEVTSANFAEAFTNLTPGTELKLTENINLTQPLTLSIAETAQGASSPRVFINGQGHSIDMRNYTSETPSNLLTIIGTTLDMKDVTIYGGASSKSIIHLYNTPDTNIFNNVTIIKNGGVGSGIIINGVKALFKGVTTITLPTTGWQGLDVDQGVNVTTKPQVTFTADSSYRFNCANPEVPAIKIGEGVTTSDFREIIISNTSSVVVTKDSITVK